MNKQLREQIVEHVFANLGMIVADYVKPDSKSLASEEFLLKHVLVFEDESGHDIRNKVWGCQLSAESQEIKILLGDCSQYSNVPEYALIVQLKNAPAYGVYLICSPNVDSEALIGCSINSKDWMECNTYLQATFLAGMEQIRDIGLAWSKCADSESQFKLLQDFIKFHSKVWSEVL